MFDMLQVLEAAVGMDYGLKGASIYVGSAGIALMYLRLSEAGDSLPGDLSYLASCRRLSWSGQRRLGTSSMGTAPLLQGTLALARKYCEDAEKRLSGLVAHKVLLLNKYCRQYNAENGRNCRANQSPSCRGSRCWKVRLASLPSSAPLPQNMETSLQRFESSRFGV